MTEIQYLRGDATEPVGSGLKIVVHICNDMGGWGAGFVLALSRRWEEPERAYRTWHSFKHLNDFALGAVQLVRVAPETIVANLIGQHDIRTREGVPPVRYDAVCSGLLRVRDVALKMGASVHMPRIGCGLAGGDWNRIEPLIQQTLCAADIPVTVYDWP
jgi:O-acetyl-ADP-ribose deacetylase (regulator of RNase III)